MAGTLVRQRTLTRPEHLVLPFLQCLKGPHAMYYLPYLTRLCITPTDRDLVALPMLGAVPYRSRPLFYRQLTKEIMGSPSASLPVPGWAHFTLSAGCLSPYENTERIGSSLFYTLTPVRLVDIV